MRNLLLFILLLVGIWWFRRSLGGSDRQSSARRPAVPPADKGVEKMQACAHCGVLVPLSEGVASSGSFFCSQEHARLGAQDGAS